MTALQVWRLAPPCRFQIPTLWGSPLTVGWTGPDHCWQCAAELAAILGDA